MRLRYYVVFVTSCVGLAGPAVAEPVPVNRLINVIRDVGPKASGHGPAVAAIQQLSKADADQLPTILAGIEEQHVLATNWLRAAAEAVAQRALDRGGNLPVSALEQFLRDTTNAPRARRLAYELIQRVDTKAAQRLVPGFLDDPSLELRRDAVAWETDRADELISSNESVAIAKYHRALKSARDLDQIEDLTKKLRDLGQTVDLPRLFGFITRWKIVAPFDNTGKKGFDKAYPPENDLELGDPYQGKTGTIRWIDASTSDEYGIVDLNEVVGKHMGAVAYAYAEFFSATERDVQLRLGCINANKVWLNGALLTANHVYHANTKIDQYVGRGRLKKGKNQILLKICQNEQTESWAQRWQFQLRVCDPYGTAILSQRDRAEETTQSR